MAGLGGCQPCSLTKLATQTEVILAGLGGRRPTPLTNRVGQAGDDQHRSDDRFTRTTALPEGLSGLLAGRLNESWNERLARTTTLPEGLSDCWEG